MAFIRYSITEQRTRLCGRWRAKNLYLMYPLLLLLRRRLPWYTLVLAALLIAIQWMAPRVTSTPAWSGCSSCLRRPCGFNGTWGVVAADAVPGA